MEADISRVSTNAAFLNIRFVHNAVADAELEYYVLSQAEGNLPLSLCVGMMLRERLAGIAFWWFRWMACCVMHLVDSFAADR
jgi:hypothetical protein